MYETLAGAGIPLPYFMTYFVSSVEFIAGGLLFMGIVFKPVRRNLLWANLQPNVKMLATRQDVGLAITHDEETGSWKSA
jgi:hypothetical protein